MLQDNEQMDLVLNGLKIFSRVLCGTNNTRGQHYKAPGIVMTCWCLHLYTIALHHFPSPSNLKEPSVFSLWEWQTVVFFFKFPTLWSFTQISKTDRAVEGAKTLRCYRGRPLGRKAKGRSSNGSAMMILWTSPTKAFRGEILISDINEQICNLQSLSNSMCFFPSKFHAFVTDASDSLSKSRFRILFCLLNHFKMSLSLTGKRGHLWQGRGSHHLAGQSQNPSLLFRSAGLYTTTTHKTQTNYHSTLEMSSTSF